MSHVPGETGWGRGAGREGVSPKGLKAELLGRSWVRLSGMSRGAKQKQGRGRSGTPSPPPGDQ